MCRFAVKAAGRGPGETRRVSPAPLKRQTGPLHPVCRISESFELLHERGQDYHAATSASSSLDTSSTIGGSSAARMMLAVC